MKHSITRNTIRTLVIEALNDSTAGAIYAPDDVEGVAVNPVVDPSAAVTDPMNPDYKPQDAVELGVALQKITKGMPDEQASHIYDQVKSTLDAADDAAATKDKEKEKKDMDKNVATSGTKDGTHSGTQQAETLVRKMVRKILSEEYQAYDKVVNPNDDDDDVDVEPAPVASEENDDIVLNDVARDMGMSVAGAKQFLDKAHARFRFLEKYVNSAENPSKALKSRQAGGEAVTTFEPPDSGLEDIDIMILKAWADYVEMLNSSGELTSADVQFMHDHPEAALELDGFREFLGEYIMGSVKPVDKTGQAWLGTLPDDVDPQLKPADPNKPDKKRSGKRTFQNAPDYAGDFDWIDDEDASKRIRRKATSRVLRGDGEGAAEE